MIATNQKFLLSAVLGLFLIGGNAEAQQLTPQQQAANRAAVVEEWADGGFRSCIVNGSSTKVCNCIAGGMRQTPFTDIVVAITLIENGLPIENSAAFKHIERVFAVCHRQAQ